MKNITYLITVIIGVGIIVGSVIAVVSSKKSKSETTYTWKINQNVVPDSLIQGDGSVLTRTEELEKWIDAMNNENEKFIASFTASKGVEYTWKINGYAVPDSLIMGDGSTFTMTEEVKEWTDSMRKFDDMLRKNGIKL